MCVICLHIIIIDFLLCSQSVSVVWKLLVSERHLGVDVSHNSSTYSCHRAFAVVETIASAYAIKSHRLYQLSPQQLISCDYNPAKSLDGCRGGSLKEAFETIREVS